jgi:hypothetical protein
MSNSQSAASVNSGQAQAPPASFPLKIKVPLALEIVVADQEMLDYYTTGNKTGQNEAEPALGFIADLFDIFDMEGTLGEIKSINGLTQVEVKKHFQQFIP